MIETQVTFASDRNQIISSMYPILNLKWHNFFKKSGLKKIKSNEGEPRIWNSNIQLKGYG